MWVGWSTHSGSVSYRCPDLGACAGVDPGSHLEEAQAV